MYSCCGPTGRTFETTAVGLAQPNRSNAGPNPTWPFLSPNNPVFSPPKFTGEEAVIRAVASVRDDDTSRPRATRRTCALGAPPPTGRIHRCPPAITARRPCVLCRKRSCRTIRRRRPSPVAPVAASHADTRFAPAAVHTCPGTGRRFGSQTTAKVRSFVTTGRRRRQRLSALPLAA